ncbi:MAG TPA: GrpB family protein, partial [Mycobacterium sp.]|nr:GrpB family protein [Mycobacterium sp.]
DADAVVDNLLAAGYPRVEHITADTAHPDGRSSVAAFDHTDDVSVWQKRFHASADPGRPTNVHIRADGRPNQQFALLFVDWLTANPGERTDSLTVEPDAYRRAWAWADSVGWRP